MSKHFVKEHCKEDDISLIEVPCEGWTQEHTTTSVKAAENITFEPEISVNPLWRWKIKLTGPRLAKVNPIPMAMGHVNEVEGNGEQWQNLYTILTELFVNALDHGVLGLDSSLKQKAEGFAEYFHEREKRLNGLESGHVELSLAYFQLNEGGKVVIKINDSGQGFAFDEYKERSKARAQDSMALSGRGIELVTQLCRSLEYKDNGSTVVAEFIVA